MENTLLPRSQLIQKHTRRWLRVREAAAYIGVSVKGLYDLCSRGLIPHTRLKGVGIRIDIRKLDELLEANEIRTVQEQLSCGGRI